MTDDSFWIDTDGVANTVSGYRAKEGHIRHLATSLQPLLDPDRVAAAFGGDAAGQQLAASYQQNGGPLHDAVLKWADAVGSTADSLSAVAKGFGGVEDGASDSVRNLTNFIANGPSAGVASGGATVPDSTMPAGSSGGSGGQPRQGRLESMTAVSGGGLLEPLEPASSAASAALPAGRLVPAVGREKRAAPAGSDGGVEFPGSPMVPAEPASMARSGVPAVPTLPAGSPGGLLEPVSAFVPGSPEIPAVPASFSPPAASTAQPGVPLQPTFDGTPELSLPVAQTTGKST